ncbi:MAG: DoxX family protein [Pseudobdellovibrionaceae bacterium]
MRNSLVFILRLVAAGILLQTLFFKFSGSPESIFIFSTLGVEPWGRYLAGLSELLAGVLLLIPAFEIIGAMMALGIISGAIASHIFVLGLTIQDDGGLLFSLACIVFISSLLIVVLRKDQLIAQLRTLGAIRS